MCDNKVSEKAIWEGAITPDSDTSPLASQMQAQPQMMFCYKCNKVIPSNSIFCPYCQIKLFAECPKCGAKYSSQYPACGQCGTNREEYLLAQRREQERKAAIEWENTRKRLEEERRRKEVEEERERQERLRRYEQEARERLQKEAYIKENEDIKKTKEYKTTYSLVSKAIENYEKKSRRLVGYCEYVPILFTFPFIPMTITWLLQEEEEPISFGIGLLMGLGLISILIGFFLLIPAAIMEIYSEEKYLKKYIKKKNRFDKDMIDRTINIMVKNGQINLSNCCIIAYREKHGLTVNYNWHF